MKLHGKIIVITGAGRGLGLHTACKLKRLGAIVVGIDRLDEPDSGEFDAYFQLDLCDPVLLDDTVRSIHERFGDIDILINNAGVLTLERAEDGVGDSVRRTLEINLLAPWNLTAKFLPALLRKGGKVINVSSLFALVNAPYIAAYATSKRAMSAYSDVLRMHYRGRLDVVTAFPGFIDTAIHESAERVGLSVKRLVSFKLGGRVLLSLEEKLEDASDGLVRICHRQGLRNTGLTALGSLAMYTARWLPGLVDAFISLRLRSLSKAGQLQLKPELIE